MKWITLPAMPTPKLLSAKPKVRKLGDHRMAFDNANNPAGFQPEPVVQEATRGPVLWVGMRSYEIAQALLKTARDPKARDAITTGLPHRLLAYFQRVEHAATHRKEELKLRREAKRQAKLFEKEALRKAKEGERAAQSKRWDEEREAQRKRSLALGHSLIRSQLDQQQLQRYHNAIHPSLQRHDPLREVLAKVEGARLLKAIDEGRLTWIYPSPIAEFEQSQALRRHLYGSRGHFSYKEICGWTLKVMEKIPPVGAQVGVNKWLSEDEHRFIRNAILERYQNTPPEFIPSVSYESLAKRDEFGRSRTSPYLESLILDSRAAAFALNTSTMELSNAEYWERKLRMRLDREEGEAPGFFKPSDRLREAIPLDYLTEVVKEELEQSASLGGEALAERAMDLFDARQAVHASIEQAILNQYQYSASMEDFLDIARFTDEGCPHGDKDE